MRILKNAEKRVSKLLDDLTNYPADLGKVLGHKDFTELHNLWIKQMILTDTDFTLQAHRGSFKTTCLSEAIALRMILYRKENIIFVRKTVGDVVEVVRQVSKILHSQVVGHVFARLYGRPLEFVSENRTAITINNYDTTKGADQLLGIGTGGSMTGKHADCVITDDIVNLLDRISRAERDRIKGVYQELQNIKNPGGVIINTGTPWHKEDAFSLMPDPERYDCYQTGLLSAEQIEQLKQSMSASLFAANYELRHIASEDIIFDNPQLDGDPATVQQARYCHIDAAYGGSDYTAFTICQKIDGKYYVFGKLWRKHVDDVLDEIISLKRSFAVGKILCEENADKGYLAKDLRKRGERVVTYFEKMNKFIKITSYLKNVWRTVIFVHGTDPEYINQICEYNEEAEHDDAPDSLACIVRELWPKRDASNPYKPYYI